jgi:hypothetical protein
LATLARASQGVRRFNRNFKRFLLDRFNYRRVVIETVFASRVARFFFAQLTKTGKKYTKTGKYTPNEM